MKRVLVLLLSISSGCLLAGSYVVNVPVADVFELEFEGKCQENLLNGRSSHLCSRDSGGRDTQLLAGDVVNVVRDCGDGWVVIDIPGQESFDSGQWAPVRGIMEKKYLSLMPDQRSSIVQFAYNFLGAPYRWGGCSGYDASEKRVVTGVDCSGLVYLAYRSVGIVLPRNARDQFLKSTPVLEGKDLQPGDCVFFARLIPEKTTSRVYHVLVVTDKGTLIESTGSATGQPRSSICDMTEKEIALSGCREITAEDHPILQRPLHKIAHGQMINGRLVFLGRFLPVVSACGAQPAPALSASAAQQRAEAQNIPLGLIWPAELPQSEFAGSARKEIIMRETAEKVMLVDVQDALPDVAVEPLYAKERNFTSKILYPGVDTCFIHKDMVPFLQQASERLHRHGYGLKMFDGYRPHRVQYVMFELVPADGAAAGTASGTNGFVADPKKGSNHNRGVAVDVTLVHLEGPSKGQEVVMPSACDEFSMRSWVSYEGCRDESAVKARDLLLKVMADVGLVVNPKEWWHFALPEPTRYPLLDIPFDELVGG